MVSNSLVYCRGNHAFSMWNTIFPYALHDKSNAVQSRNSSVILPLSSLFFSWFCLPKMIAWIHFVGLTNKMDTTQIYRAWGHHLSWLCYVCFEVSYLVKQALYDIQAVDISKHGMWDTLKIWLQAKHIKFRKLTCKIIFNQIILTRLAFC